jgi:hypothetical protein
VAKTPSFLPQPNSSTTLQSHEVLKKTLWYLLDLSMVFPAFLFFLLVYLCPFIFLSNIRRNAFYMPSRFFSFFGHVRTREGMEDSN